MIRHKIPNIESGANGIIRRYVQKIGIRINLFEDLKRSSTA